MGLPTQKDSDTVLFFIILNIQLEGEFIRISGGLVQPKLYCNFKPKHNKNYLERNQKKPKKMKTLLLILLTIGAVLPMYSQTEKGNRLIGGQFNISVDFSKYGSGKNLQNGYTMRFDLNPRFGYFIANNLAIGIDGGFGVYGYRSTSRFSDSQKSINVGFAIRGGLGGFARYYVNISKKYKFFLNGGGNYSRQWSTNDYDWSVENDVSAKLELTQGLVYFITPKFGIEGT